MMDLLLLLLLLVTKEHVVVTGQTASRRPTRTSTPTTVGDHRRHACTHVARLQEHAASRGVLKTYAGAQQQPQEDR